MNKELAAALPELEKRAKVLREHLREGIAPPEYLELLRTIAAIDAVGK